MSDSLVDYVQKGRTAGMSPEEMRNDLLASGWSQQAISTALDSEPTGRTSTGMLNESDAEYVRAWSWGGFFLTWLYFFASRHAKYGILFLLGSFVPVLNIVLWFIAGKHGRRFVWATGAWGDMETFKDRQRLLDKIGWILVILGIILVVGVVMSITLLGLGEAQRAAGP